MRGSEPRPQQGNPAGTRLGWKWEHGEPGTTPTHRPAPPNCRAGRAGLQRHQPGCRQSLPSTTPVLPRNVGGLAEQSLGKKPFPHTHEGRRAPARGESCLPLHSGEHDRPQGSLGHRRCGVNQRCPCSPQMQTTSPSRRHDMESPAKGTL